MAGTFEVDEDRAGRYRFRLKDVAGKVVASGRVAPGDQLETKAAVKKWCETVEKAAVGAGIEDV